MNDEVVSYSCGNDMCRRNALGAGRGSTRNNKKQAGKTMSDKQRDRDLIERGREIAKEGQRPSMRAARRVIEGMRVYNRLVAVGVVYPTPEKVAAVIEEEIARAMPADLRQAYSELIQIAAALVTGKDFLSPCPEDHIARPARSRIVEIAQKQQRQMKDWGYRVRQVANSLSAVMQGEQATCLHLRQDFPGTPVNRCLDCGEHLPSEAVEGEQVSPTRFFCHWLVRVYEAGHRDTSYEEGETLDNVLREINQVLGFAGYEPDSRERAELLTQSFAWNALPAPVADHPKDEKKSG